MEERSDLKRLKSGSKDDISSDCVLIFKSAAEHFMSIFILNISSAGGALEKSHLIIVSLNTF